MSRLRKGERQKSSVLAPCFFALLRPGGRPRSPSEARALPRRSRGNGPRAGSARRAGSADKAKGPGPALAGQEPEAAGKRQRAPRARASAAPGTRAARAGGPGGPEGRPRRGAKKRASKPMSARSGAQLLCAERRRTARASGGQRPPEGTTQQAPQGPCP